MKHNAEAQETARSLRGVVDERGAVIGLLKRELEDMKGALSDAETRRGVWMETGAPTIDPRLEIELDKVLAIP